MNKKIAIAAIALVAVAMTLSAIAPAMAQVRVVEYDCQGPDRRIITHNGAIIRHIEGPSDADFNNNGWYCEILLIQCDGEICSRLIVAEFDDHVAPYLNER